MVLRDLCRPPSSWPVFGVVSILVTILILMVDAQYYRPYPMMSNAFSPYHPARINHETLPISQAEFAQLVAESMATSNGPHHHHPPNTDQDYEGPEHRARDAQATENVMHRSPSARHQSSSHHHHHRDHSHQESRNHQFQQQMHNGPPRSPNPHHNHRFYQPPQHDQHSSNQIGDYEPERQPNYQSEYQPDHQDQQGPSIASDYHRAPVFDNNYEESSQSIEPEGESSNPESTIENPNHLGEREFVIKANIQSEMTPPESQQRSDQDYHDVHHRNHEHYHNHRPMSSSLSPRRSHYYHDRNNFYTATSQTMADRWNRY